MDRWGLFFSFLGVRLICINLISSCGKVLKAGWVSLFIALRLMWVFSACRSVQWRSQASPARECSFSFELEKTQRESNLLSALLCNSICSFEICAVIALTPLTAHSSPEALCEPFGPVNKVGRVNVRTSSEVDTWNSFPLVCPSWLLEWFRFLS